MAGGIKQNKSARLILNSSNQRVTAQRTLLLQLFRQSGGHLDADQLYHKAKKKYPRISLSTVYRNLQLFKKLGLIEEHHFVEEHHFYEAKPSTEHQHLSCLRCGKIVEFACPLSQQFKDGISKQYDFDITGVEVHMTGLCSNCRDKKKDSEKLE